MHLFTLLSLVIYFYSTDTLVFGSYCYMHFYCNTALSTCCCNNVNFPVIILLSKFGNKSFILWKPRLVYKKQNIKMTNRTLLLLLTDHHKVYSNAYLHTLLYNLRFLRQTLKIRMCKVFLPANIFFFFVFSSPAQSFQEFAGLLQEVEHDRMMLVGYQLPPHWLCILF